MEIFIITALIILYFKVYELHSKVDELLDNNQRCIKCQIKKEDNIDGNNCSGENKKCEYPQKY
jgi:hypothetical protein